MIWTLDKVGKDGDQRVEAVGSSACWEVVEAVEKMVAEDTAVCGACGGPATGVVEARYGSREGCL